MSNLVSRRQFLGTSAAAGVAATTAPLAIPAAERSDKAFRFGFSLNAGTIRGQKLALREQVLTAAKAGFTGFEPWTNDISKFLETGGSLKELRQVGQDSGVQIISAIGFAAWIVNEDDARAKGVETLKREMDWVSQLGGKNIAAPPAGATKAGYVLDLNQAAERYRAILELGHEFGIRPMLEIWGSSANLNRLPEAIYVAAKTAHPDACILADVYHLYKGGSDPAVLRLLGRNATPIFHLNDYPANPPRETIKDSDRIWPGDGVAPLKQLLTNLADNHCDVMLSLELFNQEYYKLPALEAAKTGLSKMKAAVAAAGLS
ncbi:MAG: sugar phosphate isomerase/epimerase family protein [Verrucomicrobiota bacterium]